MINEQEESFQKMRRREEQDDSSNQISRLNFQNLVSAPLHKSEETHQDLIQDPVFRSSFNIQERTGTWLYNCLRCMNTDSSYIDTLNEQEAKHPANLEENYRKLLVDKILKLKVLESSRLELDPNVMHPFVKIHFVDKNTGCYLRKDEKAADQVIYRNETTTFYDKKANKYESAMNDLILPFGTNCCDFRKVGDSRGIWNEEFYINYAAQEIMRPETIILFEILDFNHQALLYKDTDIYDKDNFYRVAWGFLRPVGIKTHLGKNKIQLYRYKFKTKKHQDVFDKSFIPAVYYDFIWNNHEKYEGFLTVLLNTEERPKRTVVKSHQIAKNIFEEENPNPRYIENFISSEDRKEVEKKVTVNKQLLKFYRSNNRCELPQTLVYKFQSGRLGCFRTKFIGNYLFATCSERKSTNIKVFSLQNGRKVMTMKGHREMIYGLTHTADEKYLISTGSDHYARVWQIPQNYGEDIDEQESEQYLRSQMMHTAAVYSASVLFFNLKDQLYTVTCCYDGYVRLWETDLSKEASKGNREQSISERKPSQLVKQMFLEGRNHHQKVYPTCSTISASNQFYIGDSVGDIRIYNFQSGNLYLQNTVTSSDLANDTILSIQTVERHLFVQSSDNMIRRFQLSGSKLLEDKNYAGGQFESLLVNCKISPDFRYLLTPTQIGKPVMWDVFTGTTVDIDHLNIKIKGPLTNCDWHPKYNLIVISGFVENCPIFVCGNVLTKAEMRMVSLD